VNIDLHIHTKASDGMLNPSEAVRAAAQAELGVIAIADHDSTDGLAEALVTAGSCGIQVVPAVEISATDPLGEVHILGYWIDYQEPGFQEFLSLPRSTRPHRIAEMCGRLSELGLPVDPQEVFALAGEEGSVGRGHLARVMIRKGYVRDFEEAFQGYLSHHAPAYVKRFKNSAADTISAIHRAGGVSVVAHPGLIENPDLVEILIARGVMGVEAYCHVHDPEQTQGYLCLARDHGLLVTGGSDYHGEGAGQSFRLGDLQVPYACYLKLREARDRLRTGTGS